MAVAQGPFLAAVLLLVSSGLLRSSPLPACPDPCTCQRAPLLNCSSSGLSLVPQPIQDFVTELDLSHNLLDSVTLDRPHHKLRSVWLGNNNITRLSLCIERNQGARHVRGRHLHHLRPWTRQGCVSWAPALQLLSVERNQLEQLPEGLEGSESLQVLQLSFNRISTLQSSDLGHLPQLIELHLQHNLITSLHPQMFQDLAKLQVLDLSFNKLTSLHPLMYPSLRYIGVDVRLAGNRWQCDCSMRSLRRRMTYDSSRGLQTWSVVCASPSILSGRDLLQLEEDDLNCFGTENRPELHQDVTVYSGSEILLSCSTQDSTWWTPSGQASVSNSEGGLLINDVTDKDTGLYVCVSEENEVASVFNLQISKIDGARRKTRSLRKTSQQIIPEDTQNRIGEERNQGATQSQLALAVCLSILFTFLIAFILGVLARPCIDVTWRRITKKKRTETEANSVSSAEQRQYDNEAYSNEEQEERPEGSHRERRVTFSTVDYRESPNVQYYDTVASGDQESISSNSEIECEAAKAERDTNTAGDSGGENSLQQSSPEENRRDGRNPSDRKHNIEFEHIPDPVELEKRRSSSSSSDSSEDQRAQRVHTTPKSQLTEDSVQQRADFKAARKVEVPQISKEGSEIPVFTSEPFADWSPHRKDPNLTGPDLWQETEDQFEFSDQSSIRGSFNDSKLTVGPTSNKQKRNMSSSSSSVSEDEITEYTVNSDQEEQEENIERNHNKPDVTDAYLKQDASFQQKIYGVDSIMPSVGINQGYYRHDTERHAVRPKHSSSSHSSDSDGEDYTVKQEKDKGQGKEKSLGVSDKLSSKIVTGEGDNMKKVEPMPRTKWPVPKLAIKSQEKSLGTRAASPPAANSSSSSSESDADIADLKMEQNTSRVNAGIKMNQPGSSTDLDRQCIPQIKMRSDVNAPSSASDSSSSSDSEDQTTGCREKQEKGQVHMTRPLVKVSQTVSHEPKTQWPLVDLEHTTQVKRHLDIKAPSQASQSSSSSDSEDETPHHTERQGKVGIAGPPFKDSQAKHDPEIRWPAVDLEHTASIKRRLDIKAPSPASDSSSSSDSEDETTGRKEKQEQGQVHMARPPVKVSQTVSHDPKTQWPLVDLEHTTRVKRHLDINAPSQASESSSSSDSEDGATHHIKKQEQGKTDMTRAPIKVSQTLSDVPQKQWPALDLEHTTRIKRRLDIKAPSPDSDSSSSSDSEDETTGRREKQEQGQVHMARPPVKVSQTVSHDPKTQWPLVDLEHTTRVKRHLDIKAPSQASESSSSSDSEDETPHHTERPGKMGIAGPPFKDSQAKHNPEIQWPAVNLEHTTSIKRRLDIKAPSPHSDSSSSSDSEDGATHHIKKQEQGKTDMTRAPIKVSQTLSDVPQTQWPALDLEHTTRIKRHLDIKAPSPDSDSSSSSDSEDETTGRREKQEQGQVHMARPPVKVSQTVSHDPKTQWPLVDLEHTTRVKRHLDIKAPSQASESSSSSDSEDETPHHTERPGKMGIAGPPFKDSQAKHNPEIQWPTVDLEHTTSIKRRLDIKAPSPASDSSSSSDSEDGATHHIKKQEQGKTDMTRAPIKVSQTLSDVPQKQWPALDLEHTTRIKRRLDIKAPSPDSDSSSSSDSEDETTGRREKQEQGQVHMARPPVKVSQTVSHDPKTQWPLVDLEHTTRVKRHLDIKAPSQASESSSSSDSEDETPHHTERPGKMGIAGPPFKESQAKHNPEIQWPTVDLEHTTSIKRRLDIKAPSPASDSSSSSDSEDDVTHHTKKERPELVGTAGHPFQESQSKSHDPETQWPAVDLHNITHIKRRLDIKAPSPASDSSSSSDSEDGATHHIKKQEQGKTDMTRAPIKVSQTLSDVPQTQWPSLDLEHTTRIKRRLDIKAPSPDSDSSSSSDSEDETTGRREKQEQGQVHMARPPVKVSQTVSHDPKTQWPLVDLEHTTRVKRHLDIKAPSQASESSSSSDSEDETPHHTERPGKMGIAGPPFKDSQAKHNPEIQWPAVDLEHTTSIKRRLDIKAPSPASDSSSSSDSEDGATHHIKKQEQGKTDMTRAPIKVSQTLSDVPQTQWPALDLEHTTRIKRHLDIKAPSPDSDSSSSSDSEDETTGRREKQEQGQVHMARPPVKVSQTVSHDPKTQWPLVDLEHTTRVKRHLDIKAPSQASESSSSSDSEDETPHHTERPGKMGIAGPPFKESQAKHNPEIQWPTVDLEHTTSIKRRLDIKAPSPASDSSSSSDSEDETGHLDKQRPGKVGAARLPFQKSQTESHDPDTQWPTLDLEHTTHIKRRLDIKAPSPASDSSSSSDSEDEATHHTKKERPELVGTAGHPLQKSQTKSHDLETQWPAVDLGNMIRNKRRLDIKAPSPASDSSSSSDNEDEATQQTKESPMLVEIEGLLFQKCQTVSHDTQTQWPAVDLGNNTHIKRRLDIKVPSPSPDSLLIGGSTIHTAGRKSSSSSSSDEQVEGMEDLSNLPTTVEPDPDSRWPQLGLSSALHVKRRLDIKAPSPQPDPILSSVSPGSQQSKSNSSSSDSEDENRNHAKLGASAISKTSRSPKTPVIHTSHSRNADHYIKLEKYTVITGDVGDKMTSDDIMTTPLINPELESRWATMNLGVSRFRKRLEITSHAPHVPPNLPSSPPPNSFSSSSSEKETGSQSSRTRQKGKGVAMQGIIQRESSLTPENKPVVKERLRKDYSLTKTEEKSNIPKTRRSLDIKREASSSNSSENETMDHSVPDLSLGVPRVKTNLNVKAPLPGSSNSSSSSSESENEVTEDSGKQSRHAPNMSGRTEDSMITYKRVIFKPSSPTIDHANQRHTGNETVTVARQSPSNDVGGGNASLAPRRVPSMNFDDVVRKRIEQSKRTTNVEVPPEIRWTGLGRQLPDLSVSNPRRQLDVGLLTPEPAPPSDSLASIRALYTFENSPRSTNEISGVVFADRRERKGLSALKAMSSERQKWDTENLVTDLLDGIPHYRRHDIGGTEPLQQAPPPIPATPPPFEAVELKWSSPQSSKKQGLGGTTSNLQQESDSSSIMSQNMSFYFESSNISHV